MDIDTSKFEPGAFDDPDVNSQEQYRWEEDFQRLILSLLLNDLVFLTQSFGLIKPAYFTNEVHQDISRWLFRHFDEYKVLPKRVYVQQFVEDKIKEKSADIKMHWRAELDAIYESYVPGIEDRDVLRDYILDFAKEQAIKTAFFKCLDEFKTNKTSEKWGRINAILQDAMAVDRDFDIGEEYFQTFEERYKKMVQAKEVCELFTSGFKSIDNALQGGGLLRGEIAAWTGTSGSGKSLALVRASVANLHRGKKVLYISNELDQLRVAERFDAQLADPGNRFGVGIKNLIPNQQVVFEALRDYVKDYEDPRRLIIKHFPSGEMDVAMMCAYFKQLQMRGFQPDLVVLDYIGEMKDFEGMPIHESRYRIIRALKGFASREQVCILTAMQANRGAKNKINLGETIDDEDLADAFGQTRPLDALWTLNQRKIEYEAKVARGFVSKHRFGESKFEFHIEMDRDRTLEMREISKAEYERRINEVAAHKEVTSREDQAIKAIAEEHRKKLAARNKLKDDPAHILEE